MNIPAKYEKRSSNMEAHKLSRAGHTHTHITHEVYAFVFVFIHSSKCLIFIMSSVDNNQKHPLTTQNGWPFLIAHLNKNAIVFLAFFLYVFHMNIVDVYIYMCVCVDMNVCSFIEHNPM